MVGAASLPHDKAETTEDVRACVLGGVWWMDGCMYAHGGSIDRAPLPDGFVPM